MCGCPRLIAGCAGAEFVVQGGPGGAFGGNRWRSCVEEGIELVIVIVVSEVPWFQSDYYSWLHCVLQIIGSGFDAR